jgi:acyl-coenzyme A thioesterase PaaI-like protein
MKSILDYDKPTTAETLEISSLNVKTARDAGENIRTRVHPDCVACSPSNIVGLKLKFHLSLDSSVTACFNFGSQRESYRGILHGGILAMILDDSMTNCLFAYGYVAVTADFCVQFRHPVATDKQAIVRAWMTYSTPPFHELKSEIVQNGQIKTIATGRFVEQPHLLKKAHSQTFKGPTEPVK